MLFSDKHKAIINLLADGKFHSGRELASALTISRAGVWKYLQSLPDLGIHYSAVNGKGYRLDKSLELLNHEKILSALNTTSKALVTLLEIHDSIDSTNTYLSQLADTHPSGSICLAERQTAGKGRRGRQWLSPFGHNIYLSILWRFASGPAMISGLSLVVGIAVIRALHQFYPNLFSLKWPNDIYYQNQKLGGILVEVRGEAEGPCTAIIGLGLNIYLPSSAANTITQAWTDLTQIAGDQPIPSRNALVVALIDQLVLILAEYNDKGISAYVEEWRSHDTLQGKPATLYIDQRKFTGMVNGINDQGLLLLTLADGNTQAFASGEVSFSNVP